MAIALSSNFNLGTALPLDDRTVKNDIAARNAIPDIQRYDGLAVYVMSDNKIYQLQDGILDVNWVSISPTAQIYPGTGIAVSSGSGWSSSIASNTVPIFGSAITGTPSGTTYLRGDGTWATPSGTSKWTDTGSDIYRNSKVMIGSSAAPASTLTVRRDFAGGRGGELSIINYSTPTLGNSVALNFGTEAPTYDGDNCSAQIKAVITNASNSATDLVTSLWNGTSFSEYIRLSSNGSVGINGTNTVYNLYVGGTVYSSGTIVGNSDIRYKTILGKASSVWDRGYENLTIINFKYNDVQSDKDVTVGFSAQNIEEYFPECISKDASGRLGPKILPMIALNTAAIQEVRNELLEEIRLLKEELMILRTR